MFDGKSIVTIIFHSQHFSITCSLTEMSLMMCVLLKTNVQNATGHSDEKPKLSIKLWWQRWSKQQARTGNL